MKRRLPAILLNLVFPPLGYYYLKEHRRFVWFSAYALLGPSLLVFFFWGLVDFAKPFYLVSAVVVLAIAVLVFLAVDSWRLAGRTAADAPRFYYLPHAIWFLPVYLVLLVFSDIVKDEIKSHTVSAHSIATGSMEPTISSLEFLFVRRSNLAAVRRGQIVIYKRDGKEYMHRLIGLPGDSIVFGESRVPGLKNQMTLLQFSINGNKVPHELLQETADSLNLDLPHPGRMSIFRETLGDFTYSILESDDTSPLPPEVRLSADEYFVLGDNRDNAMDSRFAGVVRRSDLTGIYAGTYFSLNRALASTSFEEHPCASTPLGSVSCIPFFMKTFSLRGIRWSRFL